MKLSTTLIFSLLLSAGLFFAGCDQATSDSSTGNTNSSAVENETEENEDNPTVEEGENANTEEEEEVVDVQREVKTISAKFVEFELGDASHYIFEDKDGKTWDFGGNEDNSFEFEMQLDEEEANEINQGYGSNPDLQGQWFSVSYYEDQREMYIDGPVGTVYVITKVLAEM